MLPGEVRLGRMFGIEIGLHFSWFVIAALLTISLAGQLYWVNPAWPRTLVWTAAGLTALAFFAAIVLHELSHAVVARARGVPVPCVAALSLARALGWNFNVTPDAPGMVMLVWFGFINITLAAFNMIPGFPLDGGRVLRAILWWRSGDRIRATRVAATMKPVEGLHQVDASEPVAKALDAIVEEDVNQLPVLEHGRIRGVISRDQILRLIAARAELSM